MRDLQYMIDVMTAARDGKLIQVDPVYGANQWSAAPEPTWDWRKHDYRIAPEPRKAREFYIHMDQHNSPMFVVKDNARGCSDCILVREVLPE